MPEDEKDQPNQKKSTFEMTEDFTKQKERLDELSHSVYEHRAILNVDFAEFAASHRASTMVLGILVAFLKDRKVIDSDDFVTFIQEGMKQVEDDKSFDPATRRHLREQIDALGGGAAC